MKKLFFILLAALLLSVQGFSQSAREILEKVFENFETNYDLSQCYKQYEIKMLFYRQDSLRQAAQERVVIKSPKKIKKDGEVVASYTKSYPRAEEGMVHDDLFIISYLYKKYLKGERRFFKKHTNMTASFVNEGYIVKFEDKQRYYTLHVSTPDYAITKCILDRKSDSKRVKPSLLRPIKARQDYTQSIFEYTKEGSKYELSYFTLAITGELIGLFEYREGMQMRVFGNLITTSKEMISQKEGKDVMTYEEALRLSKSM